MVQDLEQARVCERGCGHWRRWSKTSCRVGDVVWGPGDVCLRRRHLDELATGETRGLLASCRGDHNVRRFAKRPICVCVCVQEAAGVGGIEGQLGSRLHV